MRHGLATKGKVLAVGLGALLAPVLLSGPATADADHGGGIAPIPPADPAGLTAVPLAAGAAGEFRIEDEKAGFLLQATAPTNLALVEVTLDGRTSTGWHRHRAQSMVVVQSGTLRMIESRHDDDDGWDEDDDRRHEDASGCTEETFGAGTAFPHRADIHNLANDSDEPAVFYIVYFVPEGETPAPIPSEPPPGC